MRVLVTRAEGDAGRTAQKLADRGHEAILSPVIRITPTNEPAPAEPCDALIVTSAHAVEALPSTMDRQQPVFAVGERTAQALRQAGFTSVTAADGDAVSLSGLIRQRLETGRTLLHVTARHRKAEPAASLREAGYRVLSWEAYEARALSHLSSAAIDACRTGKIHAALHYSRRSADLFIERAGEAGLTSSLRNFPHLCLSADVAAPLKAIGASTLVAQEPFEDALLSLLGGLP